MPQLITNRNNESLLKKFENIFQQHNVNRFDVLVGFFYFSGYKKIEPYLKDIKQIRILIGMQYCEELAKTIANVKAEKNTTNTTNDTKQCFYQKCLKDMNEKLPFAEKINTLKEKIKTGEIVFKIHPSRKVHAKLYLLLPQEEKFNKDCLQSAMITGSSNLTKKGLGGSENSNYELNVLLKDYDDVKAGSDEFNYLWEEAEEISAQEIQKNIFDKSQCCIPTPEEMYYKFLYEYFGEDEIKIDPNIQVPEGMMRLEYQLDAVNKAQNILKKHDGFFLSDVVGLGKTIIALLIVNEYRRKYFDNPAVKNNFRVLIICPPPLKNNWEDTAKKFKEFNDGAIECQSSGNLKKIENVNQYQIIIVDEVHRFKSKATSSYEELKNICSSPNLIGDKKKIILLSATPLNNKLEELENQIYLFQEENNSTLEDINLSVFFKENKKRLNELKKQEKEGRNVRSERKEIFANIREKVLKQIMIRRTRTDLQESEIFSKDLKKQKIQFPKINPPKQIIYQMPDELDAIYNQTLQLFSKENSQFHYARYTIYTYLKPEKKKEIQTEFKINIEDFSKRLYGIIRTQFLKQMDSSFEAFCKTIENTIQSYQNVIYMWDKKEILVNSKFKNLNQIDFEEEWEKIEKKFEKDDETKKFLPEDFESSFIEHLKEDKKKLEELLEGWKKYRKKKNDVKWHTFFAKINNEILQNAHENKLVIFSESKQTTKYLKECFESEENFKNKVLVVSSENAKNLQSKIKENFDANSETKKNEYQIIITTEVLAEGVNLHRSNTIVNYDIPWNSIRLMQRIGRVNRVGSQSENIFIYNFAPSQKIEKNLNLEETAKRKLQDFHTALGEDSAIYSAEEDFESHGLYDERQEKDKELPYLEEIRKLKNEDNLLYQKIVEMSAKINHDIENQQLKNQPLFFMRTEDKTNRRLYSVEDEIKTISFLSFAEQLKKQINNQYSESSISNETVEKLEDYYKKDIYTSMAKKKETSLSSKQKEISIFLEGLKKPSLDCQLNDDEIYLVKSAQEHIKNHSTGLINDISKIKKNKNSLDEKKKELIKLLKKQNFISQSQEEKKDNQRKDNQRKESKKPIVILAQNYI